MVLNIGLFINFMLTGLSFAAEHQNHPCWVSVLTTTCHHHHFTSTTTTPIAMLQRPPQSTMAMKQQWTRCNKNGKQDRQGNDNECKGTRAGAGGMGYGAIQNRTFAFF